MRSLRGLLRRRDKTEDDSAVLKAHDSDGEQSRLLACNRERETYTVQVNPQDKVGFRIISVLQSLFPDK